MAKLRKYRIELELAAPASAEMEDIFDYISAIVRDSDVAAVNDIFAIGEIEITDDGEVSVEEWNGDPVDEIDLGNVE